MVHLPSLKKKNLPCFLTACIMANAVSCGVPQNKMGHLAHNWCSSYVKCRHNVNRLQNTRLLCSTNSESDSCLWFWRFFHMRWIHTVHFACLVKMWCFSWLTVSEMNMLRSIYTFLFTVLVVLAVDCCVRKCDPVLGGTWSWWSIPCFWAPELCCKCGSLGTHHSADAALAARNRTCGKALRLERGCGTLSQLRQYRQARCLRTILEHWRNDLYCAVTDFWCSKYCYRHNLFNCVGSHHWKTV